MKTEADIPRDVLADILSRLPAKCVWSLRSVCKDWKSLIEAPSFADLHLRRSKEEEEEGGVFMCWYLDRYSRGRTRFYSIDYKDGKAVRAVDEEYLHPSQTRTTSINGLVCYCAADWEIKVCNPVTRETLTLPKPSFFSSSKSKRSKSRFDLGIGFDSTSNTYKVLSTSSRCLNPPQVEIFTLEGITKGWRKLQLPSVQIQFCEQGGFYANGCAFWETCEYNRDGDMLQTLMTFNFALEKFEIFPFPTDIHIHTTTSRSIQQVGGRGCLIETKRKSRMVKMWTLAPDSSGKQVWVDHHTLLPSFEKFLPGSVIFPIPSGAMLFKRDKQYKRRDKRYKSMDKRYKRTNNPRRYICFYNEGQVVKSIRVHGLPSALYPLQLHTHSLVSLRSILAA